VDFVRYAEQAADLVNAEIGDTSDLVIYLQPRPWLAERVNDRDTKAVRQLRSTLRSLFGADDTAIVTGLNNLLREHPVSPFISGHDAQSWHLHVAERESSVAETLAAEALMGMAVVVCDLGADRFGVCDASNCANAYVDTSPNRSRRYCSDRCSSRANVAKFRARKRAAQELGS
jgi:predicted RNA-binding Zn ribbon-like protein